MFAKRHMFGEIGNTRDHSSLLNGGEWPNEPRTKRLRNMIKYSIERNFPVESSNAVNFASMVENQLFLEAASYEEYKNGTTLSDRLKIIMNRQGNGLCSPLCMPAPGISGGCSNSPASCSTLNSSNKYNMVPSNSVNQTLSDSGRSFPSETAISHELDSDMVCNTNFQSDVNDRSSYQSISDNYEDMQPLRKRMKTENPSPVSISSEVINANAELFPKPTHDRNNLRDKLPMLSSDSVSIPSENPIHCPKSEEFMEIEDNVIDSSQQLGSNSVPERITLVRTEEQAKLDSDNDLIAPESLDKVQLRKERVMKKGVSLIESFNPKQIRKHISSLQNSSDQTKKDEMRTETEDPADENPCQLCKENKLCFSPDPMYCSSCNARIKYGVNYYCTPDDYATQHCFCSSCYANFRGRTITIYGTTIIKANMNKKRNNSVTEEPWVQCDKCGCWQHQICGLFNDEQDLEGLAEYLCPKCCLKEIEAGERIPLPKSAFVCAKDLPKTRLSDHIEKRLFRSLKAEREMTAKAKGLKLDEVPAADHLVVRMVSNVDKVLKVKKQFRDFIGDEKYPSEFPYKSKVILLFQKIDEVDVCIFSMHVQEYGSECSRPNNRCFYISYIDSVKYMMSNRITATGEALRTFVYHEILIGYMDYVRKRGFVDGFIWNCPSKGREDYIFYCHPQNQKLPKLDKLRKWYQSMLKKAAKEEIVVKVTNLYDHFFMPIEEFNTNITTARLPYFDGDFWSATAEKLIESNELESQIGSQKNVRKNLTKTSLKAMGLSNPSSHNPTKDVLLMQMLGEKLHTGKENFIVFRLQYVCSACNEVILLGSRWFCNQCKNFHLCQRCHDKEKTHYKKGYHTSDSGEKHTLSKELRNQLPSDTEDKDVILDNCLFNNRHALLNHCQKHHYEFSTLRRAKASTMKILQHLHSRGIQTVDIKNTQQQKIKRLLDALQHSSKCCATKTNPCSYPNCHNIKKIFHHANKCNFRLDGDCLTCRKAWLLISMHSRQCQESDCGIPHCMDLKNQQVFQ